MRGERDRNLERAWRQRVGRQRSSGLSVRAFCAREGVAESAFYFWRRELKRRETESPANQPGDAQAIRTAKPPRRRTLATGRPPFVPITIRESVAASPEDFPSTLIGPIDLVHPGGIVIRVSSRCDADALRVVLDLLDDRERGRRSC